MRLPRDHTHAFLYETRGKIPPVGVYLVLLAFKSDCAALLWVVLSVLSKEYLHHNWNLSDLCLVMIPLSTMFCF